MLLEPLLLYHLAAFHDLCHLIDWYHLYWSEVDSTQSLQHFLDMLRLISFAINDSSGKLAFKDLKNIQWISIIEKLNQFISDFENQFSFTTWCDFDPP